MIGLLTHDLMTKIAFQFMDGVDALYFSCLTRNFRRVIFGCSGWRLEKYKGLDVALCHACMFAHNNRMRWLERKTKAKQKMRTRVLIIQTT